jgi:hypothetical protein
MTSPAIPLTPLPCSLYSQESPYDCSFAQLAPPPIAGADGNDPLSPTDNADVDAVTEDYGIVSLRMPTTRGNILVIGNVLDIEAARRDLKGPDIENVHSRRDRIMALIEEDTELSERCKEIAKFLLVTWPSDFELFWTALVASILCLPAGVLILILVLSSSPGVQQGTGELFQAGIVLAGFGFVSLLAAIAICVTGFPKKYRMERELLNADAETA